MDRFVFFSCFAAWVYTSVRTSPPLGLPVPSLFFFFSLAFLLFPAFHPFLHRGLRAGFCLLAFGLFFQQSEGISAPEEVARTIDLRSSSPLASGVGWKPFPTPICTFSRFFPGRASTVFFFRSSWNGRCVPPSDLFFLPLTPDLAAPAVLGAARVRVPSSKWPGSFAPFILSPPPRPFAWFGWAFFFSFFQFSGFSLSRMLSPSPCPEHWRVSGFPFFNP